MLQFNVRLRLNVTDMKSVRLRCTVLWFNMRLRFTVRLIKYFTVLCVNAKLCFTVHITDKKTVNRLMSP